MIRLMEKSDYNEIFFKQDLIYKDKFWAAVEDNFTNRFTIYLGYQPYKHWRTGLSGDFTSNSNPGTIANFYKFTIGYAL